MIETTEGKTAVVIRTEEVGEIGAIAIVIQGLSMRRKRSSKLAEDQQKAIEVMTEVTPEATSEVIPEATPEATPEALLEAVNWSADVVMNLLRQKKLNVISRPVVELMFDDAKKRIVAHRGVLSRTVEVDMTMIPMMIVLGRRKRDVGHSSK